jgi:hypothetical protein
MRQARNLARSNEDYFDIHQPHQGQLTMLRVLAIVAYGLAKSLIPDKKIRLGEIRTWASAVAPDNYGAGYAGGMLSREPSQRFVEIVLGQKGNQVLVSTTVYINPRAGAVGRKEWLGGSIDGALKNALGNNRRIRIDF